MVSKRIPRQVFPKGLQRDYASALLVIARNSRTVLGPLLDELPAILREARAEILRTDSALRLDAGVFRRIRELMAQAVASARRGARSVGEGLARRFGRKIVDHHGVQFGKQLKAALGVDLIENGSLLQTTLEGFVAENVALIVSMPTQTLTEIESIVYRGVTQGALHKNIAKEISDRLAIGERRAKLIARDQVGKMYGQVNKKRQTDMRITAFFWQELGDERVRPLHVALGGQRFLWSEGAPGEGIPGQPINCRCYAEPDFSSLM